MQACHAQKKDNCKILEEKLADCRLELTFHDNLHSSHSPCSLSLFTTPAVTPPCALPSLTRCCAVWEITRPRSSPSATTRPWRCRPASRGWQTAWRRPFTPSTRRWRARAPIDHTRDKDLSNLKIRGEVLLFSFPFFFFLLFFLFFFFLFYLFYSLFPSLTSSP